MDRINDKRLKGFIIFIFLLSFAMTLLSELGAGVVSTSFIKVLGKTMMFRSYGFFRNGRLSNRYVAYV